MKPGDKIVITKPGKFFKLTGEIISNNELADKPLTVDLNPYGIWSFRTDEVIQENVALTKLKKAIDIANTVIYAVETAIHNPEALFPKQKRAYKKRSDKPKEVKIKRTYNKKPKTN